MKCSCVRDIFLRSSDGYQLNIGNCNHIFCESCFRNGNKNNNDLTNKLRCPCCKAQFYDDFQTIEEAILIGVGCYLYYIFCFHTQKGKDPNLLHDTMKQVINKFESALQMNRFNKVSLSCFIRYYHCYYSQYVAMDKNILDMSSVTMGHLHQIQIYSKKMYEACFDLFDLCRTSDGRILLLELDCYYSILGNLFHGRGNLGAAVKYNKVAYELCLRSSDHSNLIIRKDQYLDAKSEFDKLPPLRFAVGSVVEFMYTPATGSGVSEWRLGKVVEQYYHERSFEVTFSAPYRLQLVEGSEAEHPVFAWVMADIDRYVRKVGVRSIEDTRYQARLDAKVAELTRVYCSDLFTQDIYCTLAQDREFVEMLQSVWQIELSESVLNLYRLLVLYRQPLVRTDFGYHVPSSEEVIAGIRAFFDPAEALTPPAAYKLLQDPLLMGSKLFKPLVILILHELGRGPLGEIFHFPDNDNRGEAALAWAFIHYVDMFKEIESKMLSVDVPTLIGSGFSAPIPPRYRTPALNELMSKVTDENDLFMMGAVLPGGVAVPALHALWSAILLYIANYESICECPFVYFFVKYCLEQSMGVPKPAIVIHDAVNMQLSREFIRCANPSCELNRLDQSTGQVKFKQCSRCKAVIYCSRQCQVAHYPDHKRLCTEHSTGLSGCSVAER